VIRMGHGSRSLDCRIFRVKAPPEYPRNERGLKRGHAGRVGNPTYTLHPERKRGEDLLVFAPFLVEAMAV